MPDQDHKTSTRYLVVIDANADMEKVAVGLQSAGIRIAARLDFIRTLIVAGDTTTMTIATKIDGVTSVEPEGTVRTQD